MTDIGWFVTFTVGLGVVFGTLEALVRTGRMGSETGRRISHVTACLYGVGIHACPGRPLATMELVVAVRALLQATPGIEPAPGVEPVRETYPLGGWRRVPVRLR